MKRFDLSIANHPIDALHLIVRAMGPEESQRRVFLPGADHLTASLLGIKMPWPDPGLLGLDQPVAVPQEIILEGKRLHLVFPSPHYPASPCAEALDRFRLFSETWMPTTVVVRYDRLQVDLPPMSDSDEVTLCWEVRDLLSESHISQLDYLIERLEIEAPRLTGLVLYARTTMNLEALNQRKVAIEVATQLPIRDLIFLNSAAPGQAY